MHLQREKEDGIANVSSACRLASGRTEAGGTPALPVRCSKSASLIQIGFEYDCVFTKRSAWSRRLGLNAKREDRLLRHRCRWWHEGFRWMGSHLVS